MIRSFSIFLILYLFLLTGCHHSPQIKIERYSYSDSIIYPSDGKSSEMRYASSVDICLLSCSSSNHDTDKIVKSINRSILELIAPDYVNEDYDSISRYVVRDNLEEMSDIGGKRFGSFLEEDEEETSDESLFDPMSYSLYNNLTTDCRIGLGDSVVCYTCNNVNYMGGAHPGETSFAYSYSLLNGSRIHPNRLFTKEGKSKMLDLIIKKLIKQEKVKDEEELKSLGFEVLQLTDNILLDKDSITFHYDTYSIAPYSYGDINIKFSYPEISDIFLWTNPDQN